MVKFCATQNHLVEYTYMAVLCIYDAGPVTPACLVTCMSWMLQGYIKIARDGPGRACGITSGAMYAIAESEDASL